MLFKNNILFPVLLGIFQWDKPISIYCWDLLRYCFMYPTLFLKTNYFHLSVWILDTGVTRCNNGCWHDSAEWEVWGIWWIQVPEVCTNGWLGIGCAGFWLPPFDLQDEISGLSLQVSLSVALLFHWCVSNIFCCFAVSCSDEYKSFGRSLDLQNCVYSNMSTLVDVHYHFSFTIIAL